MASVSTRVFDVRARRAAPRTFAFLRIWPYYLGTVLSAPRLPVLAVTHIGHSEPDWSKRLACGVFDQALRDCGLSPRYHGRVDRKVKEEAISFLTSGSSAFRFWCRALNQNPDRVRSALRKRLTRS